MSRRIADGYGMGPRVYIEEYHDKIVKLYEQLLRKLLAGTGNPFGTVKHGGRTIDTKLLYLESSAHEWIKPGWCVPQDQLRKNFQVIHTIMNLMECAHRMIPCDNHERWIQLLRGIMQIQNQ